MKTKQLSKVMLLSWRIQKAKNQSRSKAMIAAWAIFLNEDITVYYLVEKHSHTNYRNSVDANKLSLFN